MFSAPVIRQVSSSLFPLTISPFETMFDIGRVLFPFVASCLALAAANHSVEWSEWSICSKSCDLGLRVRHRTCELCNRTMETRSCYDRPCFDAKTQIIVIVLVAVFVIAIMAVVLVAIFFIKGTESSKQRSGSIDSSKQLRTLDKTSINLLDGVTANRRVLLLQRMGDSKSSLRPSSTTLKEFGESRL